MTATLGKVHASVVAMLDDAVAAFPDRVALVQGDSAVSYAEMRRCVGALARLIGGRDGSSAPEHSRSRERAGVRVGADERTLIPRLLPQAGEGAHRVATILGNSILAAIAPYAIAAGGRVHIPLNPLYTARELGYMLDDAAPSLLIVDDALAPLVEPLLGRHCAVLPTSEILARFDAWRMSESDGRFGVSDPAPDALGLLQYTGGSSGRPKGVQLSHGAVNANIAQREALLPVSRGQESVLCVMPLFHSYAMAMGLYLCAYAGATLVILPGYHPERVLDAVERHQITIFPGSPTIFVGLMNCEHFAVTDWRRVHTCYSGSAALPAETLERWEAATGSRVYEGYGQTEAGPVLSFNPSNGVVKIGSVGVTVPETHLQVVDIETGERVLPAGERGEIRARGPQVMSGYWNLPEETRESLRGGWLYTGDIGEFDSDGYLYIRDRKKDLVIVGGYNVYPREVEEMLYTHPEVREAAVVGQPDAYRGEVMRAFVALRLDSKVTADELLVFCRSQIAKYKLPATLDILAELPKTSVGKTDKKPLKQRK